MTSKEYYNSTRIVETSHWTLEMALAFAEEYHKSEIINFKDKEYSFGQVKKAIQFSHDSYNAFDDDLLKDFLDDKPYIKNEDDLI